MARHNPTAYVRFAGKYMSLQSLWSQYFRDYVTNDTEEYTVYDGHYSIKVSFLDERLRLTTKRLSMYALFVKMTDGVAHDNGIIVITHTL